MSCSQKCLIASKNKTIDPLYFYRNTYNGQSRCDEERRQHFRKTLFYVLNSTCIRMLDAKLKVPVQINGLVLYIICSSLCERTALKQSYFVGFRDT